MSGPRGHPPLVLKGTKPGLLDPTQAERILASPRSTLSFAVFSPDTAMGRHPQNIIATTSVDTFPSKRIVIETLSGRISRWRFVPRAINQPGVDTEGVSWPKVVELCGGPVIIYEEQWDIYTLDPAYECIFVAAPGRPIIRLKSESGQPRQAVRTTEVEEPSMQPAAGRIPSPLAQNSPAEVPQILQEPGEGRERESMEVDELPLRPEPGLVRGQPVRRTAEGPKTAEEQRQDHGPHGMEVDEEPSQPGPGVVFDQPAQSAAVEEQKTPPAPSRDDVDQGAQAQDPLLSEKFGLREGGSNPRPDVSAGIGTTSDSTAEPLGALNLQTSNMRAGRRRLADALPTPMVEKRTASQCEDDEDNHEDDTRPGPCTTRAGVRKRPRMTPNQDPRPSPFRETVKRYASQYAEYTKKAQELREQTLIEEMRLLAVQEQGITASSADPLSKDPMTNETATQDNEQHDNWREEEQRARAAEEEQRAKAAEEEQRARAAEEEQRAKAAEEEQRARAAEEVQRVKAAEEEQRAKTAKEERRRVRAAEEERRREKAAAEAAAEEEKRRANEQAHQQEIERLRLEWSEGDWTPARAIQRYIRFFEEFKTCNFSPDSPIEFDLIPWPVLWEPRFLRHETPTWQAVEEFFKSLRDVVPSRSYPAILNQAKLHFHPDRLSGRRILASLDERDHDRIREGFSIVVQAVVSLISELSGA